jgi:hypothetical protein
MPARNCNQRQKLKYKLVMAVMPVPVALANVPARD